MELSAKGQRSMMPSTKGQLPTQGKGIFVRKYGEDIYTAATLEAYPIDSLKANEVLVKFLAASVNPSDIYCITGFYEGKPDCPFVVGFEGVGEVIAIDEHVKSVTVGDWVLPAAPKFGTWRTHTIVPEKNVAKIDKGLGFKVAATIFLNPSTAYLLLTDMVDLKPGDVVIQNGANSAVGLALIQLAASKGIRTINIVRNRPDLETMKKSLTNLGADVVLSFEELKEHKDDDAWPGHLAKPKLAIDCVSGEMGSELFRHLAHGGTLVNYGAMSGSLLPVPPTGLVFRSHKIRGFWITTEMMIGDPKRLATEIFPAIIQLYAAGKFQFPDYELFSLHDYKAAMKQASTGFTNKKQLLVMDESLLE